MNKKEIQFTTLEEQSKLQREYSRGLSHAERLALLQELIRTTHGDVQPTTDGELHLFIKDENETLNDFFTRIKKEKKYEIQHRGLDGLENLPE